MVVGRTAPGAGEGEGMAPAEGEEVGAAGVLHKDLRDGGPGGTVPAPVALLIGEYGGGASVVDPKHGGERVHQQLGAQHRLRPSRLWTSTLMLTDVITPPPPRPPPRCHIKASGGVTHRTHRGVGRKFRGRRDGAHGAIKDAVGGSAGWGGGTGTDE